MSFPGLSEPFSVASKSLFSSQRPLPTPTRMPKLRITDIDVATDVATLVRKQIVQQAATAMLAQANQQPALVLSLLRG